MLTSPPSATPEPSGRAAPARQDAGGGGLRCRIVDAADHLLRTRGLAHLTTREIARQAGCSDGALYVHFPGKEELIHAVIDERVPEFSATLGSLVDRVGAGSLEDNLVRIATTALGFYRGIAPIITSIGAEPELMLRHRQSLVGEGPWSAYAAVAGYLGAEQRVGRVAAGVDCIATAALLLGACHHQAVVAHTFGAAPFDVEDAEYAARTVHMLVTGIAAEPLGGAVTPESRESR